MFHPELKKTEMGQTAQVGMKTGEYVIFFFSLLFVLYSISAFLKARKKEFGILTILGAERRQVNGIVFFENMIIGFCGDCDGNRYWLDLFEAVFVICFNDDRY